MKQLLVCVGLLFFSLANGQDIKDAIKIVRVDPDSNIIKADSESTCTRLIFPRVAEGYPFIDYAKKLNRILSRGYLVDTMSIDFININGQVRKKLILTGIFSTYRDNASKSDTTISGIGTYSNGKRTGQWKWYYNNRVVSTIEEYVDDSLISMRFFSMNGKPENPNHIGDRAPVVLNLHKMVKKIAFPQSMRKSGIPGRVEVRLLIDKTGRYSEHVVVFATNKEFLQPVEAILPLLKFTPCIYHNEIQECYMTIPFHFKVP
jgi:hypothetical protein